MALHMDSAVAAKGCNHVVLHEVAQVTRTRRLSLHLLLSLLLPGMAARLTLVLYLYPLFPFADDPC